MRHIPPTQWERSTDKRFVQLTCPLCGRRCSLQRPGDGHAINTKGEVMPSVVCPYKCSFHEFVVLDGWTP